MFHEILVAVLIATLLFKVAQPSSIGDNGSSVRDPMDLLQDTINRVNASLIQHYNTIQVYTNDALVNPLIVNVDKRVNAIIAAGNVSLLVVEAVMTRKNNETSALGPEYAHCVQTEAALRILQAVTTAMKACGLPAEEFLVEYARTMDDYVETTRSVSLFAYNRVFDCVPEGDELTEDEINDAVDCINYEQFGAHHSLNLLEQMLVSNQYNGENTAGLLVEEAGECVDSELEVATVESGDLIVKVDICVAAVGHDQKVTTSEDLQVAIDAANATLTETYEMIRDHIYELMDSEFIEDAIQQMKTTIEGANETVVRMSNATFKIIEEMEESGRYGRCLVGVREKAQVILDEAVSHLPECVVPLEDMERACRAELVFVESMLETQRGEARDKVVACLPVGNDLSEEEVSTAISCVDAASFSAQRSFYILQHELNSLVEKTVATTDLLTYQARRCVDTSAHVAGDQTGYLRFLLDECKSEVDSSTPNPVDVHLIQVTMDELRDALDRVNATLQGRYSRIDEEVNFALNSQTIMKALFETNQKITNSEEPLINLGELVEEKVTEAESKNFTDCVEGVRETCFSILEDTVDALRECVRSIEEVSDTHAEHILAAVDQYGNIRDVLVARVVACLPATSEDAGRMQEAMRCLDLETVNALRSMSLQEEMIRTNVQHSVARASTLTRDALTCVDEMISRATADIDDLIRDIADCMTTVVYTGF